MFHSFLGMKHWIITSQDCLPDCDETHYTASVSASPFRKCDFKNMGLTALCNLGGGGSGGEMGEIEPPMWGESVINQYRSVGWRPNRILCGNSAALHGTIPISKIFLLSFNIDLGCSTTLLGQ